MKDLAIIMLAAGLSSRFGSDNKLLSDFRGKPLCAHSAELAGNFPREKKLAVVPAGNTELSNLYANRNWSVLSNSNPEIGLSHSLKIGVRAARELSVDKVIICLADMPLIDQTHINRLREISRTNEAVMSCANGALMPPAAFRSSFFDDLLKLDGDAGAKGVFLAAETKQTLQLSSEMAIDIDTLEDLRKLNSKDHSHV